MLSGTAVERQATDEQLARVHATQYLDVLRSIDRPTMLEADTVASETSWRAALLAAGVALEAVDRNGFALVRPPGHHALPDRAMGFCLLNNVALAARYAQAELGVARVAIVDFDVHHGNGTEAIFRDDGTVLFCSLHQWPFYPGTGGPGTSDGTTLNVPLPAGTDDPAFLSAFEQLVEPAVRAFEPDLLLVSAGFDAHEEDPLGELALSDSLLPRARQALRRAGASARGRARRRLQPRDAATARGERARRLHRQLGVVGLAGREAAPLGIFAR